MIKQDEKLMVNIKEKIKKYETYNIVQNMEI
jgi:hypothetical protein